MPAPEVFSNDDPNTTIVIPKYLIHHRSNPMDILIADLHEDRASICEQIARDGQPITQDRSGRSGCHPATCRETLDLFRLARNMISYRPLRRGSSWTTGNCC